MEYQKIKQDMIKINDNLSALILRAKLLPFVKDGSLKFLEKICNETKKQLQDDIYRIAIVGTIKSGKSTLSNYLCQGDYLKRGAGVITSFITKVRKGKTLKASLKLKSWNEINKDITLSIKEISLYRKDIQQLLPFDIRDKVKREKLQKVIMEFDSDIILKDGIHDPNYSVLYLYLKGYERVKDLISDDTKELLYQEKHFAKHRAFVGDDSLAIFLKDVLINIDTGLFDESTEIADCQGSDSPNPMHLIMIQDYLISSQLVIYVISSRIGIREADVRFLHIIKKMGMIDDVIFVLNCDFDEHDSVEDMLSLLKKTQQELSIFKEKPHIFAFSALFNLLKEIEKKGDLSERDQIKFERWKLDSDLVRFSDSETQKFLEHLNKLLTTQRYAHLIEAWYKRISLLGLQFSDWISANKDILSGSKLKKDNRIQKLTLKRERLLKIKTSVENALEGFIIGFKKEIKGLIDRFFDKKGIILSSLRNFISSFSLSYERHIQLLQNKSLSYVQYRVFMECKREVDLFIAQELNPNIINFVRELDAKIKKGFSSIIEPYLGMISELMSEVGDINLSADTLLDIEEVKRYFHITLPSVKTTFEYSFILGTETVIRSSFYKVFGFIKSLIRKKKTDELQHKIMALEDGLKKIRRQIWESVQFSITNYKENLKYQYALALIDSFKQYITSTLNNYLNQGIEAFSDIEKKVKQDKLDKEALLSELDRIQEELRDCLSHIEKLGNSGSFIHLLK